MEGANREEIAGKKALLFTDAQNDRARAIGKQVGGLLVLEIEKATHPISACNEDVLHLRFGHQIARTLIQRGDPARAGRVNIVTASLVRTKFALHDNGSAWGEIIRRVG